MGLSKGISVKMTVQTVRKALERVPDHYEVVIVDPNTGESAPIWYISAPIDPTLAQVRIYSDDVDVRPARPEQVL
jgi:hypothetical protein